VRQLDVAGCEAVSASEARRRIARGEPWEHLVPPGARALARQIYSVYR
jgi:hypothetical protein